MDSKSPQRSGQLKVGGATIYKSCLHKEILSASLPAVGFTGVIEAKAINMGFN